MEIENLRKAVKGAAGAPVPTRAGLWGVVDSVDEQFLGPQKIASLFLDLYPTSHIREMKS
ncbi:hypothetical protein BC938DRAFT_483087 [Jimgerdemannia flammicorona]|uniref:Uncharacterized protein n=1 Tax=Jimgerdemannia flammicorona TaxID=994334 RepID=A0A433QCN3_9FUNG|nr:hypothetical protein BC938DRAFT_483087 [Jimgerdemannia flammicorona]